MHLRRSFGSAILFCFVLSVFPVAAQAPQDKGGNRPQPGNRPESGKPGGGSPGGNNGNRPGPGGNNGGNRPNPGGNRPGPGRPQPSRPTPGRPSPGRPNPGHGRPPQPGHGRPQPGRPGRPPQWGRPPQNRPSYNFRPSDRNSLRRFYMSRFGAINRARRPVFAIGGFFPYADIRYISPLPPELYGQLPPPPLGYSMGYYDGYVVVYDPVSYFIANVIDLLQ
jgi:hypothetical protein